VVPTEGYGERCAQPAARVCGQNHPAGIDIEKTEVAVARQRAGRRNTDGTGTPEPGAELDVAGSEPSAAADLPGDELIEVADGDLDEDDEDAGPGPDRDEIDGAAGETGEVGTDADETDEEPEAAAQGEEPGRSPEIDAFWDSVRIDVLEIALPKGVGYTLRAYRPETEITPTDISERESDAFPDRNRPVRAYVTDEKAIAFEDEDDEDEDEQPAHRRRGGDGRADLDETDLDETDLDEEDLDDADLDLDEEDEDDTDLDEDDLDEDDEAAGAAGAAATTGAAAEEPDDEAGDEPEEGEPGADGTGAQDAAPPEEVPVFLGRAGRLYLFRSPEGLADFVRSGEDHDLSQVATWAEVVEQITAAHVRPLPDDQYELDLVVENLRGGHDAWDPDLLIQAGEIARDLGYALRLPSVMDSLAPGSPLDDLDEVMRTAAGGGLGGFFARRKLKKIGAEAAPLSWRTIIGKISAAVDWRD
jgi:hypothetical protein